MPASKQAGIHRCLLGFSKHDDEQLKKNTAKHTKYTMQHHFIQVGSVDLSTLTKQPSSISIVFKRVLTSPASIISLWKTSQKLKFHDWAAVMIANPLMYQGKPVKPNGTIANYFGLVKTRFMEDDWFKHHQDLQGDISWFTTCKTELVQAIRDKINKCVMDCDIDKSESNQVAIIQKKTSTVLKF